MRLDEIMLNEDPVSFEQLIEMARIKKANSGINVVMAAWTKDNALGRHGPRIKVSNIVDTFSKEDNFSVSISENPAVKAGTARFSKETVNNIQDWVKANYVPLMKLWHDKYDNDADFYADLTPVTVVGEDD